MNNILRVVNSTLITGKSVVVFENLKLNGKVIATHADIKDEGQTVNFPKIRTKVDKPDVTTSKNTTIKDTVSYKNLVPGKKYKMEGKLGSE